MRAESRPPPGGGGGATAVPRAAPGRPRRAEAGRPASTGPRGGRGSMIGSVAAGLAGSRGATGRAPRRRCGGFAIVLAALALSGCGVDGPPVPPGSPPAGDAESRVTITGQVGVGVAGRS